MTKLTFAICLLPFAIPCFGAPVEVLLSSTSVLPGQTLRVEADGVSPENRLKAFFLGKAYPFFVVGPDAQRALIGVPLGKVPGTYPLRIRYAATPRKEAEGISPMEITVATRAYQTENVSFAPAKAALMAAERKEGALIGRYKKHLSRQQWWEGAFGEPVQGPLIGEFGVKRLRNMTIEAGFHKGVDVRAVEGTPVLAANTGVVLLAANFRAHGKTVLLNHGQGVMTIYLHMQKLGVKPGQRVGKGQAIGLVGSTGLATAPHLHWQVYVHGVPVDPKQWTDSEF